MSEANDVLTGSAAPRAEQEIAEQEIAEQMQTEQESAAQAGPESEPEAELAAEASPAEEPVDEAPAMEAPAMEAPAVEEPVAEEPVAEEPVAEEPVIEEPIAAAPAVEAPADTPAEPVAEATAEVAAEPVAEATAEAPAETPAETPAESAAPAEAAPAVPAAPKPAKPARERRPARAESAEGDEAGDAAQRVVRTLAVGQEVQGTVKRVSEFGAFVDIGVGRDGLVHISELSVRRIGKVTDVLNEGDQVTLWIKKLDRERNRISLTMIPPGTRTVRDLQKDDVVPGTVTRLLPYGAFVDIGVGRDALLHVREMGERFVAKPEDVVKVGDVLDVRIIEIQRRRGRIDLSIKGLREEPEPEPQAASGGAGAGQAAAAQEAEPEPEIEDPYADVEPVSAMEAAWKKAVEASGGTYRPAKKGDKRDMRDRRERQRQMQEEIMNRTLKQGK